MQTPARLFTALVGLIITVATVGGVHDVASAATLTVTNTNDAGAGTLRQALVDAANGDTIQLPAGTISITSAPLTVNKQVTIAGVPGSSVIRATAVAAIPVMVTTGAVDVTISGVRFSGTILEGLAVNVFGAILNASSTTTTLVNSSIDHNRVVTAGFLQGGGVDVGPTRRFVLDRSAIVTNTFEGSNTRGGGVNVSGGVGTVFDAINSTISGNVLAPSSGGSGDIGAGILVGMNDTVNLTHVTLADNRVQDPTFSHGGNIDVFNTASTTVVNIRNSIIAGGEADLGPNCMDRNPPAAIVSGGGNVTDDNDGNVGGTNERCFNHPTDRVGNVVLGLLANNGGSTRTHALGAGSIALGAGIVANCASLDQRGLTRATGTCDAGAFGLPGGVSPSPLCAGRTTTVDVGRGQRPTAGADVILGTSANDRIDAGGGNDVVCGGAGNDVLIGGAGNDLLLGEAGKDRLKGGAGAKDVCKGGPALDRARTCEKVRSL